MPLVFSKREMKRRLTLAQQLIERDGLDALLVSSEENFQYFTGVSGTICLHYSITRPAVVVVPWEGAPIAVVGTASESVVKGELKDVRSYNSTTGVPTEMYVKALKDAGLSRGKVGLEEGLETRIGQPLGKVLDLFRALPDVKFVDAAPLLWELRMKKSGEEIALMREAAKITAKARQKTFDLIHAGDTQREIARTFGQMMLRYGADRVAFVHVGTREPVNLTQFHSDKPVARGEMLYLDGGAYLRSHTIDYPRLATIGAASKKQVASHEAIRRVCREMVEVVKPGTNCSEIWRVGHRAIREAGFATFDVGRTGHGQGMLSTEPPSISSDDKTVLVPGMVLGIEPFTMQGDVPIIWEDVYAVTDDGADRLTLESEELREI